MLVTRDSAQRLPGCLLALSRQTYRRIGVLAVDDASTDRSPELLERALGSDRVIRVPAHGGFAAAVAIALRSTAAEWADYVLLLHDDTMLEPTAVAAMVDAAERIEGAGVVGPKILHAGDSSVLCEIGMSIDRFATPYSPLEEGEIDHGQYDRIREVQSVSSTAMLISREALARVSELDPRFPRDQEDLDFCWSVRLAGLRVLMAPHAVARHDAEVHRSEARSPRGRYERERAALGMMLKNYSLVSLAWILPTYLLLGAARIVWFTITRHFEDAYHVLAAWGWNLAHLPGTIRRRRRVQSVRSIRDRSITRTMAPVTIRLRRWALAIGQVVVLGKGDLVDGGADSPPSAASRARSLLLGHPVAAAWAGGMLVAAVAYRDLLTASPLLGGALGALPDSPTGFFAELGSGLRNTGLGGAQAATPALGFLGLGSVLAAGSPALLQKILLLGLPFAAAVGCYRAVRLEVGERVPAVLAAAAYGLSATILWGLSLGRLDALVFLAGLPWLATKLTFGFLRTRPAPVSRWIVGAALGLAILVSFFPGAALAAGVLAVALLAVPPDPGERGRGAAMTAAAAAGAALLVFPVAMGWFGTGAVALGDLAGTPSFGALARLSLGGEPGSWSIGFFLPLVAVLGLAFAPRDLLRTTGRVAVAAVSALYLAWLSAAGYLPEALSNPVAYLGVLAFGYAVLVAVALTFCLRGLRRAAFGHVQLVAGVVAAALVVGLGGQAYQAARGAWTIGDGQRVPDAYPLIATADNAPYRVLWVGSEGSAPFPAPGGLPDGRLAAGPASVRFSVRAPHGTSLLDLGRPAAGPGYLALRSALAEILVGRTRHGGALLAPFGIRHVVADPADLPRPALRRLSRQVDLELQPVGGLIILENHKAVPTAAWVSDGRWADSARSSGPEHLVSLPVPRAESLRGGGGRFTGAAAGAGFAYLGHEYSERWVVASGQNAVAARPAFGWATVFPGVPPHEPFVVRFDGQRTRTVQTAVLAVLWGAGLWMTRRRRTRRG